MLKVPKPAAFFILLIPAVILGFSPIAASEEDSWHRFYLNSVGDEFYYESTSLAYEHDDELVAVQVRIVSGNPNTPVKEVGQVIEMDCPRKLYRRLAYENVLRNDSVQRDAKPTEWSTIAVNTPIFILADKICKTVSIGSHHYKKQ